MINYLAAFVNTNGLSFPDTLGINASGGGATDGTEFVKLFVDDIWGRFYAILDYAGLTPDSVTEAPGTSQHIEALQKGFGIGPGMGVVYWKDGDPATNGDRVLLLNGQGILRATYPDLDTAVYVGDGNNPTASKFYRADDAAGTIRNISGIYLILPETRGYALRGLDTAASVDPDGASRDMGSIQLDSFQGFDRFLFANQDVATLLGAASPNTPAQGNTGGPASQTYGITGTLTTPAVTGKTNDGITTLGAFGTPRYSTESRIVNVATRFGITY